MICIFQNQNKTVSICWPYSLNEIFDFSEFNVNQLFSADATKYRILFFQICFYPDSPNGPKQKIYFGNLDWGDLCYIYSVLLGLRHWGPLHHVHFHQSVCPLQYRTYQDKNRTKLIGWDFCPYFLFVPIFLDIFTFLQRVFGLFGFEMIVVFVQKGRS